MASAASGNNSFHIEEFGRKFTRQIINWIERARVD